MGATLETIRVEATDCKEAVMKIIHSGDTDDCYSGWFNTCSDYVNLTYKVTEDDFQEYVTEKGEKRVLYVMKDGTEHFIGWAWCAC